MSDSYVNITVYLQSILGGLSRKSGIIKQLANL